MDVSFYFTFVAVLALLGNDKLVKAASCNTMRPNYPICKEYLQITNGRACYFGNYNTLASISCYDPYTFDANAVFSCTGQDKRWLPKAHAVCTFTVPVTSQLYSSESNLFSSAISLGM
ncbi:uncharacterized protein LOC132753261 [Ruditapes philippinarum]|uniref:uncharacterized protein LOC132753261 n=1 Tax=Ruditapes philippinarum TaxID=129788 RepID=UPI00295A653D|nr:uncharacterized protein LOC132753261 [Ruditapes philippinarum]